MISDDNKRAIRNRSIERIGGFLIRCLILILTFALSYLFDITYNEDTSLFIDKVIDVCSIFFGVFVGSIYLFKKLKESYKDFIRFSKSLLIQNLLLIFLSFFIIIYNDKFPSDIVICEDWILKPKVILFSGYVSFFTLSLWNIVRFIIMISQMLESNKE
ncbi:hypothetical protein DSM02_841 [Leeuwenhoekiella polynyae]|uniref:Uncharacterized protein n=1 Tax=Leeuwenhoekiella polynyae TaxID=1550906 RepID=A0A4Q0PFL5_9FLAO|nr:hypothetical protein DSM02_841 [Leeuwenhoekiella polynyae]